MGDFTKGPIEFNVGDNMKMTVVGIYRKTDRKLRPARERDQAAESDWQWNFDQEMRKLQFIR